MPQRADDKHEASGRITPQGKGNLWKAQYPGGHKYDNAKKKCAPADVIHSNDLLPFTFYFSRHVII